MSEAKALARLGLLPPAQEKIVCHLSGGGKITRDKSPPYRWWREDAGDIFRIVSAASVKALLKAGRVQMEEVETNAWTSHRLVLKDSA